MVQLTVISGKKAGAQVAARRFPFHIGRAAKNQLQLDDDGVWDSHLTIRIQKKEGFTFATTDHAITAVNDEPIESARLRNGDILTIGSAKVRFSLAPPRQRGLRVREFFVWTLIAAISAAQVVLVYWLVQMD
ncbi:MAG TPA: FHA domain-containing protein [Verrucomicrobiae bacterium]|nr:FHA domain-containing protein [Verrucomicrobiae bacterium]